MHRKPVIAVTGTLREASVLKKQGVKVIAGGSSPKRLIRDLRAAAEHCDGIISFGMGGAIDRRLKLCEWIIGKRLTGAFPSNCDERWIKALQARLPLAKVGAVHADGRFFAGYGDKMVQSSGSAALVVDMESHIAAAIAEEGGVPFAVIRCISDVTEMDLPPAVDVMMNDNGGINVGAIMGSIMKQPGQLPALGKTVASFAKAFMELGNGARAVGERMAFDER